ncbi:MAG: hypothetical protein KDA44_09745 [Planctomycetales bacterium]|nr:hypothetical protein [Planctomycetales bacterium]
MSQRRVVHLVSPAMLLVAALVATVHCGAARAHTGRRFQVEVVAGKLQAQGVNTGDPDGFAFTRPYPNSIHDHWVNVPGDAGSGLAPFASSFLPDFEVPIGASFVHLKDYQLSLQLMGASRWLNPPTFPAAGVVPNLTPLAPGEVISIESPYGLITTETGGTVVLSDSVPEQGIADVVMNYQIAGHPSDVIHVLKFILAAQPADPLAPDLVADSDPIYVLFGPDGADKIAKLHYASLYLEEYLGTAVPEPAAGLLACACLAFLAIAARGRAA